MQARRSAAAAAEARAAGTGWSLGKELRELGRTWSYFVPLLHLCQGPYMPHTASYDASYTPHMSSFYAWKPHIVRGQHCGRFLDRLQRGGYMQQQSHHASATARKSLRVVIV